MYKIAIVEDEYESAENLKQCLEEYTKEYGEIFNIIYFKNGLNFIDEYTPEFDIVFMDIDMPQMNGLSTAKELRKIDPTVTLIFVTFLAKYAIKGYEVEALDYVLKPINYNSFKIKIDRAIRKCQNRAKKEVILPSSEGMFRIEIDSINYVEIVGHEITYHTSRGEIKAYGTMRAIEELLPEKQFFKCNRCYLINLRSVMRVDDNCVFIGKEKLVISRPRKKAFIDALHEYTLTE